MTIPFDLPTYAIAAAAVAAAYVIFGISAFGAALFTVPLLAHFFPLDFVLPMSVLLDVSAALALGARFSRDSLLRSVSMLLLLMGVSLLVRVVAR